MAGTRRRPPPPSRREPWWHELTSYDAGHEADRLARTLAHLCGPRCAAPGDDGDPLRPGSSMAIMPNGEYCTYIPRGRVDPGEIAICTRAFPAPPAGGAGLPGGDAGPPCALCLRFLDLPRPASVAVDLFCHPTLSLCDYTLRTQKIAVPRDALDAGRMELARRVMRIVREDECRMCIDALGRMEPGGHLRAGGRAGMAALLELLEDAGRPAGSRLDTVLLAPESLERLAGGKGGRGHGEWRIRAHASVPAGAAYAMSAASGPALARGPTAIDCGPDAFYVRHYCLEYGGSGGVRVELSWGGEAG
ncbi:MAG: hypothetical protein OXU25_01535 [Thaumarchaeota archaeon]|nr:hypothetical protein [Nitrososphaerota archaeon]